jgi:hypothetical protein
MQKIHDQPRNNSANILLNGAHGACATGMLDRAEELRQKAAECLALAKKAVNPEVRTGLIIMAQRLYELADHKPSRWAPPDPAATTI